MMISTKGRYALRFMADLALNDSKGYISLKEVSRRQGISVKYLEQIAGILFRAGYIVSARGSRGGYRLGRMPEQCGVGDILRAAEGSLAPVACVSGEDSDCAKADQCLTRSFWLGLSQVIDDYVDSVTLADIIKDSNNILQKAGEGNDGKKKV